MAVNAVNPNKPLPLIVGIGYVSDKAYVIEERTRDYTFRQKVPNSPKEEKPPIFYILFNKT